MLAELLIMLGLDSADKGINALTQVGPPDKWGVYLDNNGNYRMQSSLKKVNYGFTKEGEYVLKYNNGQIARNIGLEIAKENEDEAKKQGKHFYLRAEKGGYYTHKMGNDNIEGPRYCKVNGRNDKYYVRRDVVYVDPIRNTYYHAFFYIDMNYRFVAFDDELDERDIKLYGKSKTDFQKIIKDKYNEVIEQKNGLDWKEVMNKANGTFHCGKSHRW